MVNRLAAIPFPWHFILLIGVFAIVLFQSFNFPLHDFGNYYFGALALMAQPSLDVYDPFVFNEFIQVHFKGDIFANYSPHPPFTALLFTPLTRFNPYTAKLLFNLTGVMVFVFSLYRMMKSQKTNPIFLWLIPLIFFIPLRNNISFGQTYLWLFALLSETYLAYISDKKWRTALFLSLAIILKLSPALIVFYFLFKRQYKVLFYCIIILLCFVMVHLSIGGDLWWSTYFNEILPRSGEGLINVPYSINFQSFMVFLKYLFRYDGIYNPDPWIDLPWLFPFLYYSFAVLLLTLVSATMRKEESIKAYASLVLILLLLTPVGSTYSLILTLFVLVRLHASKKVSVILVTLLSIVCWIPPDPPLVSGFLIHFIRLLSLIALIFVFFPSASKAIWKIAIFTSLVIGAIMATNQNYSTCEQSVLLKLNDVSMIGRLYIENNELKARSLSVHGFVDRTVIDANEFSQFKQVEMLEHEQISSEILADNCAGNVKQFVRIDGKEVFILSDYNHGYHFFQLRKLKLD